MKLSSAVLRVVVHGPAVAASLVWWLMVCALLPPLLGVVSLLLGLGLLVALSAGRCERLVIGMITGSRAVRDAEAGPLDHVVGMLGLKGLGVQSLRVARSAPPRRRLLTAAGSEVVIVSPAFLVAVTSRSLTNSEAAAVMVHALRHHQAVRPKAELAVLALTVPWRVTAGVGPRLARVLGRLPLVGAAWKLRALLGGVCVAQSAVEGRVAYGVVGGAIVVLTYAVPAAARCLDARGEVEADRAVVALGLGPPLAAVLTRSECAVSPERIQRLAVLEETREPTEQPRLVLVR